jgi:hypothetical protein
MNDDERNKISELVKAARPFLDSSVVDETSGTVELMDRLERAIEAVEELGLRVPVAAEEAKQLATLVQNQRPELVKSCAMLAVSQPPAE